MKEKTMRKCILFLIGVFSLLIACEKNDTIDSTSDDRFLELAYDNSYHYPEGFYSENISIGNVYYENTVSIKPTNERESIWIELNTNDKEQAKTWSDFSNEYSSVDREIVKENVTEKYFEFVRVNILNEKDSLLSRVHRTAYFVSLHDKFTNIDTVGIYNSELTVNNVKDLVEYLWSCGTLGLFDKVIDSKISDKEDRYEHYIQSLEIVYGDFGLHDLIYVYDNKFQLNKSTKILTVYRKQIKEIEGKYHEGW